MFPILTLVALAALLNGTGAPEFVSGGTANPKLSGPMIAGGRISTFEISPDGLTVVYFGDQDTDDVSELFSVPIDGSTAPVKISGPMVAGSTGVVFARHAISPDNSRVAYAADPEAVGAPALYSAPMDGSATPTLLHARSFCSTDGNPCETAAECPDVGHCAIGGQICETDPDCAGMLNPCLDVQLQTCDRLGRYRDPRIDPTSTYVVHFFEKVLWIPELYSVSIDGSAPAIRISAELTEGSSGIDEFEIAPTGDRVVYTADQETAGVVELYSAPIDGSAAAVRLNPELVSGGEVGWFEISPDGAEVLYTADQETDDIVELYVVPIDGSSAPEQLSDPAVGGGVSGRAALSFDGTRAIYIHRAGSREIYSVPIDGSALPIKLSHPLGPGEAGYSIHVSPDSPWVVYLTSGVDLEYFAYYSVTIDGSAGPHLLQAANLEERFNYVGEHRLIYMFQYSVSERDFFSVPLDGSQPPVPLGGGVLYSVGPIMGRDFFVYAPYPSDGESGELYAIPQAVNLPPVLLNVPPTLHEGEILWFPGINADGTWVVYLADQDSDDVRELYSSHLDLDDDGVPDETDNCPRSPNPGQGPVVFGQDVLATSKIAFSWEVTADVSYVRGPLDSVDAYATDDNGSLTDVVTYTDPAEPAAGAGFFYLFKPGGSCAVGSWQTGAGAEPGRDEELP